MPPAPERGGVVEVAGCPINWVGCGSPQAPAVVLVHGARANWHWWARAAEPLVAAGWRAVALDLSGHGDSGRRPEYRPALWAREVAELASRCGGAAVAGHSMGGLVGIAAAARYPEAVTALVLLDVRIRELDPATRDEPRGTPGRPLRSYRSRQEAVDSFRLLPAQPIVNRELVREVAAASVREESGGWRWKFDPAVAQRFTDAAVATDLERLRCPVSAVYGAESEMTSAETVATTARLLGAPVVGEPVAGAFHHLLLDRPQAVGEAVCRSLGGA